MPLTSNYLKVEDNNFSMRLNSSLVFSKNKYNEAIRVIITTQTKIKLNKADITGDLDVSFLSTLCSKVTI